MRGAGASASAAAAAEEPPLRRKKKAAMSVGLRTWLVLDSWGRAQVVEAGKHAIMRRTGLPARDLRILDPQLSYPSTVLGRERAIVINLEHIKAIITAQEVLLLNSKDPSVLPFVDQLRSLIILRRRHHQPLNSQQPHLVQESGGDNEINANWTDMYDDPSEEKGKEEQEEGDGDGDDHIHIHHQQAAAAGGGGPTPKLVPLEFVALEACLEAACTSLNNEATTLEREAHPALDKLTSKISTLNLERVRQIKSRLVAITGRVHKVRDELENLLDDDGDMAEMYLTEKLQHHRLDQDSSISSIHEQDDQSDEGIIIGSNDDEEDNNNSNSNSNSNNNRKVSMERDDDEDYYDDPPADDGNENGDEYSCGGAGGGSTILISSSNKDRVEEVQQELEMLLEAYFVEIEGTLNKLSALREYVDDTEDYINIMMDDKQNHLLQIGVMVSAATMIVSAFVVVAGLLGMNIRTQLFDDEVHGMNRFLWTVGGGTAACVLLYVTAIAWWKHKKLLQ